MSKKAPVQFGRGTNKVIGKTRTIISDDKEYISKCGEYKIEGRHFVLPYSSYAYTLYKMVGGQWVRLGSGGEHDKLADAKFAACADRDPNYEPTV